MKYSFHASERNRRINRTVRTIHSFHLRHQNTALIILSFVFTYYLIKSGILYTFVGFLGNFGYISAMLLGFLFSFGFTTTPAATMLFILSEHVNPFLMALTASLGAGLGNLAIYFYVKRHLMNEIRYTLAEEFKIEISRFEIILHSKTMKKRWMKFFVPALAGVLTAMPLPTEVVVALLWSAVGYNARFVFIFSVIFSFIGILSLALLGYGI